MESVLIIYDFTEPGRNSANRFNGENPWYVYIIHQHTILADLSEDSEIKYEVYYYNAGLPESLKIDANIFKFIKEQDEKQDFGEKKNIQTVSNRNRELMAVSNRTRELMNMLLNSDPRTINYYEDDNNVDSSLLIKLLNDNKKLTTI